MFKKALSTFFVTTAALFFSNSLILAQSASPIATFVADPTHIDEQTADSLPVDDGPSYSIELMTNVELNNQAFIGPGNHFFTLNPTSEDKTQITLSSFKDAPTTFYFHFEDIVGSADPNISEQYLDASQSSSYGAKNWITIPFDQITLQPKEKLTFEAVVNVPANADAGDHYAALIMEEESPTDTNNSNVGGVSIHARSAIRFVITVTGNIRKDDELKTFSFNQNFFKNPPSFLSNWSKTQPVAFNILFENRGSVHASPRGEIEIFNWLGQKSGIIPVDDFFVYRESTKNHTIYSSRTDESSGEITAGLRLNFGYYRARLNLESDSGQFKAETGFWYWPMPATGIILLSIITLIVIIIIARNQTRTQRRLRHSRR